MSDFLTSRIIRFHQLPLSCDHDNLNIMLVLHGECDVKRFSSMRHFTAQEVFFINAHEVYALSSEEGCVLEAVSIPLSVLEQYRTGYGSFTAVDSIGSQDQFKEISLIYRDCAFLKDILISSTVMKEVQMEKEVLADKIISALMTDYNALNYSDGQYRNVSETAMDRYYRVLRYIHAHKTEKLTLQDAAEAEEVQKNYFALLFKQMSHMTFLECVNRLRLYQAEEILLMEDCANSEIIRRCSFSDSKYFYKYFQEAFGTTPAGWKKQWKHQTVSDCIELTAEEAVSYVRMQYEDLMMINTDTHFYQQYCLLKEMEKNLSSLEEMKAELELYHPENILIVDDNELNTWYGFDLIMDFVKEHNISAVMKINAEDLERFEEDLLVQIDKAVIRYDASVLHKCSVEIHLHRMQDQKKAMHLQQKLQQRMQGCRIAIVL